MGIITTAVLLLSLTIPNGIMVKAQGENQRCLCINLESRPFGRRIGPVTVHPASSHCSRLELIATLKTTGEKICLDPEAPWVKRVIDAAAKSS